MNKHAEIRIARVQISQVLEMLAYTLGGDDEVLKLDTLEGETILHEVVSSLLADNEDDDGVIAALGTQIDIRGARLERFKARIDARKKAIASLMDCAAITKMALAEATLSLRTLPSRAKVVDAAELPDAFVIIEQVRKPDREAINAAIERGEEIPGVLMTNGTSSLTVRRK